MKNPNNKYNRTELEALLYSESAADGEDVLELWDQLEDYREKPKTDVQREGQILELLLEAAQETQSEQKGLRLVALPVFRYAVAASLIVLLGMMWLLFSPIVKTAPFGTTEIVHLPDGSAVTLNSGTSISYSRFFLGERDVDLTGEAYFDVVADTKPFTVLTFNATVRVLGTSFNVRAWEQSIAPMTEVSLVSGKVLLNSLVSGETITMTPGDQVTISSDDEPESSNIGNAGVATWRNGDLIYNDEFAGVVLEDVQRRFGVSIQLSVPEIAKRRINVSFHTPPDAEIVVRTICGAYSLNYRKTSGGFEIFDAD